MLRWIIIFLAIGTVAHVTGYAEVAVNAISMAKVLLSVLFISLLSIFVMLFLGYHSSRKNTPEYFNKHVLN
jgi:uncharacterized membrane protein YtjA (UPF0391 family)